jgi:type I restriction enzyme S subunit
VKWADLVQYEFALPPLGEQLRMAEVLAAAADVVEALRHLLVITATAVESQIAAFDRRIAPSIKGTLKAAVARLESGKSPSGFGRPAEHDEFGVLKVSAVADWSFVEQENKMVPAHTFSQRFEVGPGDLLVTRANADPDSVGRTCLVTNCRPGLMISDKTWRLILKPECRLDPMGVLAWTKSPSFRKHVRSQLGGTDAKNISKPQFLSAPFPGDDVGAFNEFAEKVRSLRSAQIGIEGRLEASVALSRKLAESALNA